MQTNDYAQRLAELQQQPDHELKQIGDQWQTPKELAMGLFWHFTPKIGPIVLDLFADECNALCAEFYTSSDNALTQEWANDLRQLGGAAFANPPYSRPQSDSDGTPITGIENILAYCREQRELGAKIMLLLKAGTSEGWWPEDADFIQFVSGRIGFKTPNWYVPRDPKKDKPSSSGFASAVVIFDKDWKWERRPFERLKRNDLETQGSMIMNMIESRATVIAESMVPAVATIEASAITEPAPIEESDCQLAEVADDNYQLDLEAHEEPELTTYADKTLDELEDVFNRGFLTVGSWNRFVAEATVRFGFPGKYSHREVMFVLTSIDTDGEMTGTTKEQKALIRNCTVALTETEKRMTLTNNQRQDALAALIKHIDSNPLPFLFEQVKIIRAALAQQTTETNIAHELSGNSEPMPEVSSEIQEHQGTSEVIQEIDGDTLPDTSAEQEESEINALDSDQSISTEWLNEQYMQLEDYPDADEDLKGEIIEKTIRAIEDINDEYSSNPNMPKAETFIDDYFSSKPNIRIYMNIRSLRAAFRSLVHASIKEVAHV